jgi:hypothetical protein
LPPLPGIGVGVDELEGGGGTAVEAGAGVPAAVMVIETGIRSMLLTLLFELWSTIYTTPDDLPTGIFAVGTVTVILSTSVLIVALLL